VTEAGQAPGFESGGSPHATSKGNLSRRRRSCRVAIRPALLILSATEKSGQREWPDLDRHLFTFGLRPSGRPAELVTAVSLMSDFLADAIAAGSLVIAGLMVGLLPAALAWATPTIAAIAAMPTIPGTPHQ
jgi:hypothetical protein